MQKNNIYYRIEHAIQFGKGKKKQVFFAFALTFHYLCTCKFIYQ